MNKLFIIFLVTFSLSAATAWGPVYDLVSVDSGSPVRDYGGHVDVLIKVKLWGKEYPVNFMQGGMKENNSRPIPQRVTAVYDTIRYYFRDDRIFVVPNITVKPSARALAAYTAVNNKVYIYGGSSYFYLPVDDTFWMCEYNKDCVDLIGTTAGGGPGTMLGSIAVTYGDGFYMFGGVTLVNFSPVFLNDAWYFDTNAMEWNLLPVSGDIPEGTAFADAWIEDDCDGTFLHISDGETINGYINREYRLNLETLVWSRFYPREDLPFAIEHSATGQYGDFIIKDSGDKGCEFPFLNTCLVREISVYIKSLGTWLYGAITKYAAPNYEQVKRGRLVCDEGSPARPNTPMCTRFGGYNITYQNSDQVYDNSLREFYPKLSTNKLLALGLSFEPDN